MTSSLRLYLFDRLILGYCALMVVVLLVFGRPLSVYLDELGFYVSMFVLVLIVARYLNEDAGRLHHFLRYFYPVLLLTAFYRMTGGMMFLFFDHFFDPQLTAFEHAILGVNPTIFIDRHWLNVPVTEILSACYFFYYPMIPVFTILVYIYGDYEVVKSSLAAMCITFFVSYLLFALYPVEGPRWHFASDYLHEVQGPFFRQAVNLVIKNGAVRGGCMPSSHFGVALVMLLYVGRYYRRWLWLMLPIVIGLAGGTVWGRFHYVSDVVVGGLIGLAATLLIWKIAPVRPTVRTASNKAKELHPHHAS